MRRTDKSPSRLARLLLAAFALAAGLAAVAVAHNPPSAYAEEEAPATWTLAAAVEPIDLPAFLRNAEQALEITTIVAGENGALRGAAVTHPTWSGHRAQVLQKVRSTLFAYGYVLGRVGAPEEQRYRLLDLEADVSPALLSAEPVLLNQLSLPKLAHADGRRVQALLRVSEQMTLDAAADVLRPQLSGAPWSAMSLDPRSHGIVITDFAPRVALAHTLLTRIEEAVRERQKAKPPVLVRSIELETSEPRAFVASMQQAFQSMANRSDPPLVITAVPGQRRMLVSGDAATVKEVQRVVADLQRWPPPRPVETFTIDLPEPMSRPFMTMVHQSLELWSTPPMRFARPPAMTYIKAKQTLWVSATRDVRNRMMALAKEMLAPENADDADK